MVVVTEESTSKYAQAGEVRLHYNEIGTGYPVIGIHGGGPGASSWSNFKQNIPTLSERYRLLLVDMPQFGKSDKVVIEGGRLTFVSRALRAFMDELGIERAHFIGNSMGGQCAIKLAIDSPERVDKLVVIGSTPVSQSLFCPMPLEGIKMINNFYKGTGPSMERMRELVSTLLYDQSFMDDATLRERYEAATDPDVVRVMTSAPPAKQDLAHELHKVEAETLIVWGMDDRFGALDIGLLMLRTFKNARMHIFSRCGHWAQVEHAAEFDRLVLDFLSDGRY